MDKLWSILVKEVLVPILAARQGGEMSDREWHAPGPLRPHPRLDDRVQYMDIWDMIFWNDPDFRATVKQFELELFVFSALKFAPIHA